MLAMRRATPEDCHALEAMIQARSTWMKNKRLPNWPSWGKHVHELAASCMRPSGEMWVLTENHDRLVGCTTILRTAAPWAWSASEADEPAFYLSGTVTDPAERHRKLGTLIADWAVDRAARQDISRVRRDCTSPALAAYYEKQNFCLMRRITTPGGNISYALERRSERIPELTKWFMNGDPPTTHPRNLRSVLTGTVRSNATEARFLIPRSPRGTGDTPPSI